MGGVSGVGGARRGPGRWAGIRRRRAARQPTGQAPEAAGHVRKTDPPSRRPAVPGIWGTPGCGYRPRPAPALAAAPTVVSRRQDRPPASALGQASLQVCRRPSPWPAGGIGSRGSKPRRGEHWCAPVFQFAAVYRRATVISTGCCPCYKHYSQCPPGSIRRQKRGARTPTGKRWHQRQPCCCTRQPMAPNGAACSDFVPRP
jgi:hypothetical protein